MNFSSYDHFELQLMNFDKLNFGHLNFTGQLTAAALAVHRFQFAFSSFSVRFQFAFSFDVYMLPSRFDSESKFDSEP